MSKVFLDLGHGGSDSGAVANGLREKDINLEVGLQVKSELIAQGHEVMCSRESDKDVSLEDRVKMANEWGADLFISIHHNAGGGDGYEVIFSIFHGKGEVLANKIATQFNSLGQNAHGVGTYCKKGQNGDYYFVIRETKMPCVITEYGFMDSSDVAIFDTPEERSREAKAIVLGVCDLLGTQYNAPQQINYEAEAFRVKAYEGTAWREKATVTGLTNAKAYAQNFKGFHVVVECVKDNKGFDLGTIPVPNVPFNKVKEYQKLCNAIGVRDAYGRWLDEDGIVGTNTQSTYARMPVIRLGSKGEVVRWVQKVVNAGADGVFGGQTDGKVREYQSAKGLTSDGIVGKNTYKALVER